MAAPILLAGYSGLAGAPSRCVLFAVCGMLLIFLLALSR